MGHRRAAPVPSLGPRWVAPPGAHARGLTARGVSRCDEALRRAAPAMALALAALGLLGGCDESPLLDGFELSGRVEELVGPEQTGDPIEGATVTFVSDTLIVADTTSDGDGRYFLRLATDHRFGQVRAEAEGFRPAEATVFFDQPTRRVDLEMRRARAME